MNLLAVLKWTGWLLMATMLVMAFSAPQFKTKERVSSGNQTEKPSTTSDQDKEPTLPLIPSDWYVSTAHAPGFSAIVLQVKSLPAIAVIPVPSLAFIKAIEPNKVINRFRFRDLMLSTISISTRPFRAP